MSTLLAKCKMNIKAFHIPHSLLSVTVTLYSTEFVSELLALMKFLHDVMHFRSDDFVLCTTDCKQ